MKWKKVLEGVWICASSAADKKTKWNRFCWAFGKDGEFKMNDQRFLISKPNWGYLDEN